METQRSKRRLIRFLPLLFAGLAAGMYFLLPLVPGFTETVVTGGLFRAVSVPYGWLIQWLPFSLTEALVVVGIPAGLALAVVGIIRLCRAADKKRLLLGVARIALWILSILLLTYMLLHGANFYRLPAAELMDLPVRTHTTDELAAVCLAIIDQADAVRQTLPENPDGTVKLAATSELLSAAGEGYAVLDDTYPFLWGATNRVKSVSLSYWWSFTGITGMYFPFFAEANVNTDQPKWCVPFTAAHELAHTRGFSREDECNFLAFLSCIRHPDAGYRYSGYYMAYVYCVNALYAMDADKGAAVASLVGNGMRQDLTVHNLYWDHFEGPVQDVSDAINDGFITSQGVPDGSYSYGRCVDLILAWADQQELL